MYSHIQLTSQNEYQEAINTAEVLLLGQSNIDLGLNFDPWSLTTGQLCGVVLSLFKKLDLVDFMNITDTDLLHFISDVERGYFVNPYHSFHHAVDVSVMVYHFLANCSASAYLEQDDILALLIASLCHDVGHPGTNNVYQINAKTPLAQKYDENSILETHSCHLTLQLIHKHQLLEKTTIKNFIEQRVEELILYTDMKFHFQLLEDMRRIIHDSEPVISSESSPSPPLDPSQSLVEEPQPLFSNLMDTAEFRLKVSNAIIHAADISNPARPWELCKTWSDLVVQEFYHQGDLEKQAHLPISLNMDRDCSTQYQIALDFDEYLVQPFFFALSQILPKCYELVVNLQSNRMSWIQIKTSTYSTDSSSPHTHHSVDPQFARRVSFSPGTVDIPLSFNDDVRRHSSDGSRFAYRHARKTRTWARQNSGRKRDNCSPERMNVFNSLLKHTLTKVSSTESLSSQYEHSTPVS